MKRQPIRHAKIPFLLCLLLISLMSLASAQTAGLQGQLSAWFHISNSRSSHPILGLRYIPTFSLKKSLSGDTALDIELSAHAFGTGEIKDAAEIQISGDVKPYRMWLRFSSSRFEARIGLQKVNFGSAALFRPLMWFDRIDPNDPLQLTDGVYGLLLRYYFLNNANIWLWGLYGNDEVKGWETIPSHKKSPEYGGRIQVPFLSGEIAWTYHHRRLDAGRAPLLTSWPGESSVPENRIAIDGKWDAGIGFWVEGVLIHQDFAYFPLKYQRMLNIGFDTTVSLGNGLHFLAEHFHFETSEKTFGSGERMRFSSFNLSYPLGLLDQLRGMIYHNWENGDWHRFLSWQRTYDRWSIFLIGFWNPDSYRLYNMTSGKNLFSGRGIQIMVVFNH